MRKLYLLLVVLVCALAVSGQRTANKRFIKPTSLPSAARSEVSSLPIRRVVLYSNGVAYIERRGTVTGNAEINLSFKQSQIDDVLKSMVVLDLGQGKIGAVSYNSSEPVESRMSEIPFSVNALSNDGGGIAGVLSQLQGAKVAVTSTKGSATGAILTVERKQIKTDKESTMASMLVIASENGEISSFNLNDVRSLKLLDEGTRKDLNEFASATASTRRRDAKTITVTSLGPGTREMIVSYTIAAPIWKTTYRVVLDPEGKPFFQGWAIVDNISEEDWNNVQLSLVSGSPISFIQNLQKPFYRYRPVIPTPQDLQLQPQVYEPQSGIGYGSGGGMGDGNGPSSDSIAGSVRDANGAVVPNATVTITNNSTGARFTVSTDSDGEFEQSDLAPGSYTAKIDRPGFKTTVVQNVVLGRNLNIQLQVGNVSEAVTVNADSVQSLATSNSYFSLMQMQPGIAGQSDQIDGAETSVSNALTSGNSGVQAAANGSEIGDLFEYRIGQPVTVSRDRSALIPIVQTTMDGERVSVYNEAVRLDRPFSGVLLKNTTDLTLENGSLTVIDGNAYAGEALMERLKPKEQRIISFALDLGTNIRVRQSGEREPAKLIRVVNGVFQVHYFRGEQRTYQITNQTERPKTLYIEYPVRDGWELSGNSAKPDYTTQRYYRFRVELKPFEDKELAIAFRQPLMDSYGLSSLSRNDLELFLQRHYVDEATRARLEKLIDLRLQIGEIDGKLQGFGDEVNKITSDQKRLRENIEALSKTPEAKTLIERYIAKAGEQETQLEEMEKQRKTMTADKEKLEQELAVEIKNFEVK
jgi:hypothetical protein